MDNLIELKERLDNHQIDVNELSFEEIDALCDMYEREISEIDNEIQDKLLLSNIIKNGIFYLFLNKKVDKMY